MLSPKQQQQQQQQQKIKKGKYIQYLSIQITLSLVNEIKTQLMLILVCTIIIHILKILQYHNP
jgi:hypothetical protein